MEFATCLNCMDGRVQLPVIHWIKEKYGVEYVDVITEAGMDGFLVESKLDDILRKIDISLKKHGSNIIFVVGHHDCGGNPVDEKTHRKQVHIAVDKLKKMKSSVKVIGLWVSDSWVAEKIIER
ncbi:MAG: carbonic anhydrase [Candidatus Altiarchaeota archaeon]|nr:carbonic anhydrase [Candidatus Altiarchaeota archaeon]